MPKLISTWSRGAAHWTEYIADDGWVGLHCLIQQPTSAEVAEAYQGIPRTQQESHRLIPFHFSIESNDPMILAIAQEHGVLVQPCPISSLR